MKNSTLLIASAMLMASASVNAQAPKLHKSLRHMTRQNANQPSLVLKSTKNNISNKLFRNLKPKAEEDFEYMPKTVRTYLYNPETSEWEEESLYEYTYDQDGNQLQVLEKNGENVNKTINEWNADGNNTLKIEQISEDGGATYVNHTKRVQEFDPIVDDLVVSKTGYIWDETAGWEESGDAFRRVITRDLDNNITNLQVLSPLDGVYEPIQRYTIEIDETTKQPKQYKFEELYYDYDNNGYAWEASEYLTDMVWKETNGQLYSQYEDWYEGGNELKSAKLMYEEEGQTGDLGTINVEYKDNDMGFHEVFEYSDMPQKIVSDMQYTDDNDSYTYWEKNYYDFNGDGVFDDENDLVSFSQYDVQYNDHGDCILDQEQGLNENMELEVYGGTKYDYTYDTVYTDTMKECVMSDYDYESQGYVPSMKLVTESFTNILTDGISNVNSAADNDVKAVYNLQGMKVNAADTLNGKGIFIVKRGGKTIKVAR